MAAPGLALSIRLDQKLRARVDRFARTNQVSRSEAVRILLGVALEESTNQIAAREATMRFTRLSRRFVSKFATTVNGVIPAVLAETTRELDA